MAEAPGSTTDNKSAATSSLSSLIRRSIPPLIEIWMDRVRRDDRIPSADALNRFLLKDHMPNILEQIAEAVERAEHGHEVDPCEVGHAEAKAHAITRFMQGYQLPEALRELSHLRGALAAFWLENRHDASRDELLMLHQSIDETMVTAADEISKRTVRSKDEFLALLSHELRTPLTVIIGYLELMSRQDPHSSKYKSSMATVVRNTEQMARMVEDLLDVSRIAVGHLRLHPVACDLATLVTSAYDAILPIAAVKNVHVDLDVDPTPTQFVADPSRLQQVLTNLLNNAVKFTPSGGAIVLRARRNAQMLEFSVTDDGEGISPEFMPHLFERFQQESPVSNSRRLGLGLGLTIAKKAVELHGGTISARSLGKGQGATFEFAIPFRPVSAAGLSAQERATQATPLGGLKILVIDDNRDSLAMTTEILGESGACVTSCGSASDAMNSLREMKPELVVCDLEMDEIDGYAFVTAARTRGLLDPRVPVVALTALAFPEDRKRTEAEGFARHIAKPFKSEELVGALAEFKPKSN